MTQVLQVADVKYSTKTTRSAAPASPANITHARISTHPIRFMISFLSFETETRDKKPDSHLTM